ncbi:MAG TPA: metallophosphoesterase [Steroidobacteraceae bacterium]
MRRWPVFILTLLLAAPAARADPAYRFTGVPRVVVFPDTHGAYEELVSVLRETAVVDESLHWRAGTTHLVSLGDLLDRGPGSRQVLDLLMRLETEAREAGGAFHMVLGNHEVMNIVGDLRYVSAEEYAAFAGGEDAALRDAEWRRQQAADPAASRAAFDARFPSGYFAHRQAYSPPGRYGAWLLGKPFLITVNDTAFVHGGLPAMVARLGLEATNKALHAQLAGYLRAWESLEARLPDDHVEFRQRPDAAAALGDPQLADSIRALQDAEVFTTRGPTWYRGQALCNAYDEADNLASALERLGVARVVVGHTTSPTLRVATRLDGRVVMLDAGMLRSAYRGSPAAYVFEQGRWSVAYADRPGERSQPAPLPRAIGARPAGMDDDALESWLAHAEIVGVEELAAGITNPQRVTLSKDGVELRAVFKQLSTDFGVGDRQKALNFSDRFEFEVAAYRLDRLLGLDMVPVTVPRTVNGRRGVLQFWIDGAINLRQMTERQLQPEGWCDADAQYNLMNVFDVLIHNTDRTQENALFTRDWTLVLIDHSRAFATYTKDPRLLYLEKPRVPAALAARLQALDAATLHEALGPWLHRRQIDAILKRRDRLLGEYRARTGDAGP